MEVALAGQPEVRSGLLQVSGPCMPSRYLGAGWTFWAQRQPGATSCPGHSVCHTPDAAPAPPSGQCWEGDECRAVGQAAMGAAPWGALTGSPGLPFLPFVRATNATSAPKE